MKKDFYLVAHFLGPLILGLRLFAQFPLYLNILFAAYILAFPFLLKEQLTGMSAHIKLNLFFGEIALLQWCGLLIWGVGHCFATGVLFTLLFVLEWKHGFASKRWKI